MRRKITPYNGFDKQNPYNARQNNYAWSMAEFNGYVYVGTGRNIAALGINQYGLHPLSKVETKNMIHLGEIWRFPLNQCKNKRWEKVFTAPEESRIYGFRDMAVFTDKNGKTGLCVAGVSLDKSSAYVYSTFDGENFARLNSDLPAGFNTRAFLEFDGTLYAGINNTLGGDDTYLCGMDDFDTGLKQINMPNGENSPTGNIMSLAEMRGNIYIGTATGNGFEVWRSPEPKRGEWTLIVDKGAGDELNEWAMTMAVFKGKLYVGTAVTGGTISVDHEKGYVPFKGFDLIEIDKNDNWKVVVGREPIVKTTPTKGARNKGRFASGFSNAFNCYLWQMQVHDDVLYIGTWDAALIYKDILINEIRYGYLKDLGLNEEDMLSPEGVLNILENTSLLKEQYNWLRWWLRVIKSLPKYPREHGFDMYSTDNAKQFYCESLNGFDNKNNYGIRTMISASDGNLYIGTANVYEGCEVWQYKEDDCEF